MEAGFQNFAAGLIIAAVAEELFPLMVEGSSSDSMIGITVGFVVGLAVLNGIEAFIEHMEAFAERFSEHATNGRSKIKTQPEGK